MIYIADSTWNPTKKNPFTEDGCYNQEWSCFIYDATINYFSNVYADARLYTIRFSPDIDKDNLRFFDFLSYELSYHRNVIVKGNQEIEIKELIKKYHLMPKEVKDRESDVKYMVHSTTQAAWQLIEETGALLSPNELKKRGIKVNEIGLKSMLEPADYSDYIMLDVLNGCSELVVNSRKLGYVCIDSNINYEPGVRLYFDVNKMFQDGIVTRDGLHLVKIKDRLPLRQYLRAVITADDLRETMKWTPTLFTEKANQLFYEKYFERVDDGKHKK